MNEAIKILLEKLRPQMIPLVEQFDMSDNFLMSAIGNSYGDIYETHLEWAKDSSYRALVAHAQGGEAPAPA